MSLFHVSLLALHASLAAIARCAGVSRVTAAMFGGVLTYMAAASQNFIFAIQISPTLALACAIFAGVTVLKSHTMVARSVTVATLLALSVRLDSGVGVAAVALGGGIVVSLWPWRSWWCLVPATSILAWWYTWGDLGPSWTAPLRERFVFAARLLVRSVGAILGGGAITGVLVLLVAATAVVRIWRSGQLEGRARTLLLGGCSATLIAVGGITQSRSAIPGFSFVSYNRYLQNVGIPFILAFLPCLTLVARSTSAKIRARSSTGWVAVGCSLSAPILVAITFISGIDDERSYASGFMADNATVEAGVKFALAVMRDGCPDGRAPDPASTPVGGTSPQMTTALLTELHRRDLLDVTPAASATDAVVKEMCGPK